MELNAQVAQMVRILKKDNVFISIFNIFLYISCGDGFYVNDVNKQCAACQGGCITCDSKGCLTCPDK